VPELFDEGFKDDPWTRYAELRARSPVHLDPRGFYVLTRHADCLEVLRSKAASADAGRVAPDAVPEGLIYHQPERNPVADDMARAIEDNRPFIFRDPPEHTKMRGLVQKAFTPRMVEGLRPRIAAIVETLLDRACARGHIDVVADLAYPLPIQVICEMLGIPEGDRDRFSEWSRVLSRSLDPEFLQPKDATEERIAAVGAFGAYFLPLLEERRRAPGDDLLSALAVAEEDGEPLTDGQMMMTAILLLVAGHETTVNLISGGVLALLSNPGEQARWRADPSLTPGAVEELLRFVSPVQMTGRVLTEDMELSGTRVPAGRYVLAMLASANRDPAVFTDPDTLVLDRVDNRHLGFGFGIHHCLGAPLARLETAVTLERLLARTRSLELTGSSVRYRDQVILRGLVELPVRLRAA